MSEDARHVVKLAFAGAGILLFNQAHAWLRHDTPEPPPPAQMPPAVEDLERSRPKNRIRRRRPRPRRATPRHPPDARLPTLERNRLPRALSDGSIRRVVAAHRGELLACYRRGGGGKMTFELTIQPSGRVSSVQAPSGSAARCAARRMKRWRFPAFRGTPRHTPIPIVLAGGV